MFYAIATISSGGHLGDEVEEEAERRENF